jgi:alkylated DNA repair protein (DNA oxidative demethylase)
MPQNDGLGSVSAILPFDDTRTRRDLAPGAVHVPGWLDLATQRRLVSECRAWAANPAGMRATRVGAGVMSARTVCLGWHWRPYEYVDTTDDGSAVKPFPPWLAELGRSALTAAGLAQPYEPDVAIINFYDAEARMGMHQDRDERSPAPVVSLSIGATGVFRFGNPLGRGRPWIDLPLESGDLFVFCGPSRLAYHGVTRVLPGTGPDLGLSGRLNITLRESGLPAAPGS